MPVSVSACTNRGRVLHAIVLRMAQFENNLAELAQRCDILSERIKVLEIPLSDSNQRIELEKQVIGTRVKVDQLQISVQNLQVTNGKEKETFCEQLADSVTSITGLQETVSSKDRCHKYVWGLLFLAGLALTFYFLDATTREYLKEPTFTKVNMSPQTLYEYPPFVFCHEAWFDVRKAETLGLSMDAFKYSLGYWRYDLELRDKKAAKRDFFTAFNKTRFRSLMEYYEAISIDLEPHNNESSFLSSSNPSYFAATQAEKAFLPYVSFCNAFKLPRVDSRLGVLREPDKIVLRFQDRTDGLVPVGRNWMLFWKTDVSAIYAWSLSIPPFTQTFVTVKAERFITIDSPEAPCRNYISNETAADCMANCQNRLFKKATNCQIFWLASKSNAGGPPESYCNDFDAPLVGNGSDGVAYAQQRLQLINSMKDPCYNECPHRCERIIYHIASSGDNLILKDYAIGKRIEEARKSGSNTSITAIYFLHDAVTRGGIITVQEVSSYSFVALVNNIGGTLGLFIGGTLMTVAQLVMFFVHYFREWKKRRCGGSRIQVFQPNRKAQY